MSPEDEFCTQCGRRVAAANSAAHPIRQDERQPEVQTVSQSAPPSVSQPVPQHKPQTERHKNRLSLTAIMAIVLAIACCVWYFSDDATFRSTSDDADSEKIESEEYIASEPEGPGASGSEETAAAEPEEAVAEWPEMKIPSDALVYNGHSYYLYDNDCSNWDEILAFCEAKGGYPAVINDSEENETLYEYMIYMGRSATFIGYTDRDTEGLWKWVEGKSSDFTDWGTNNEGDLEPNSDTPEEDYAQLDTNMQDGHWNDCAFGWDTVSFICEWDGIK